LGSHLTVPIPPVTVERSFDNILLYLRGGERQSREKGGKERDGRGYGRLEAVLERAELRNEDCSVEARLAGHKWIR
jgi:hypothetical protein